MLLAGLAGATRCNVNHILDDLKEVIGLHRRPDMLLNESRAQAIERTHIARTPQIWTGFARIVDPTTLST
jgi:hypothetical protein